MGFKLFCEDTKTPDELVDDILSVHHEPDDFEEGDIVQRIEEYYSYTLKEINIKDLDLDEWDIDNELVDKIRKEIENNNGNYPPIIVSPAPYFSIIDGTHRANAVNKLGYKKIKAYVGNE